MVNSLLIARSFSTVSCGLLLGSTAWAGLAVMPSLIAAQTTSHAKLSVFNGLIEKAGIILPPVFLGTVASLGYLSYSTVGETRTSYAVAAASLVLALGLQVVIVPKNKEMQRQLQTGEASKEDGTEGSRLIGEILYWNWGRVILSAVAFGAVLYAAENNHSLESVGAAFEQTSKPMLAARNLEYGLE
ncbi:protein of unknown function [Taphrina deformans PYCC 5710]|uniref:DUF1772-domain-containing protein n=1 Tax=Taphrina deformans (strain PYCC 5710 / ATCC 11124 / CBS 356.35 / IMI 108563 / JCM 9778 / NBRC 8474) TaxID=1097556 RepID=R4XH46_TAPDE|nr:protein of unknown function [Taphrina deformans PYCC 5710]|eukprot:CCG85173.1 protein of unknown function [Taphrina deformans PYCC 5710]